MVPLALLSVAALRPVLHAHHGPVAASWQVYRPTVGARSLPASCSIAEPPSRAAASTELPLLFRQIEKTLESITGDPKLLLEVSRTEMHILETPSRASLSPPSDDH